MATKFLNAIETALICLLLASSYTGFFFSGCVILILAKEELTSLTIILVFAVSVAVTHGILRWLSNVQWKQRVSTSP